MERNKKYRRTALCYSNGVADSINRGQIFRTSGLEAYRKHQREKKMRCFSLVQASLLLKDYFQ
jgi:hypothetical protein